MHRPRFASAPLAMVRFQNGLLYACQVIDLAIPESGSVDSLRPLVKALRVENETISK